jgi:hypothetical protein
MVGFAQDFQHFLMVTPDHYDFLKCQIPRLVAGLLAKRVSAFHLV